MVEESLRKENLRKENGKRWEALKDFFKDNWLSVVLAFLGLVLVLIGGVVMVKNGGFKTGEEILIEEEASEEGKIKVDLQGAVLNPGVYELDFSSRVQDLLIAAGGLSQEADREWVAKNLNQAAKLADGEKFYIPRKGESQVAGTKSSVAEKININTASLSELETLWGIGKVRGQKIIEGRPFLRIEELLEREIIPSSVFEKIKDKISVY